MSKVVRQFVKYRNRKIHELGDEHPYTTMEELLAIVERGEQIRVTEDETGSDITAFTLARIIYDRSRVDKDAYRASELHKLIVSSAPDDSKAA
jgi:polyhydroxyalkanoate synthesis regulator protein